MKKPDEEVAERIIAEFRKRGLLSDLALEKLKPRLVTGSLSSVDWRLVFDTDRPKKEDSK
ncbi:MAG: hypothetical protein HY674_09295 [Chloroflexi bacterium]|nr:hypothetical protein [Chloroflexota bacterium]